MSHFQPWPDEWDWWHRSICYMDKTETNKEERRGRKREEERKREREWGRESEGERGREKRETVHSAQLGIGSINHKYTNQETSVTIPQTLTLASAMKVLDLHTSSVVTPNSRLLSYTPRAFSTSAAMGTVEFTCAFMQTNTDHHFHLCGPQSQTNLKCKWFQPSQNQ